MGSVSVASAQIGEPQGSFQITIKQGANVIASDTVSIGLGGELSDLKASFQDGDPESFAQIGTVGPVGNQTPIILKVTTDNDPNFRISHWYIDVPISLANIHQPSPNSLFQLGAGDIEVTVTSLDFQLGSSPAMPVVVPNGSFFTSFMRDWEGHFYKSPNTNAYNSFGNGVVDVQVPGAFYTGDGVNPYDFDVLASGNSVSWSWNDILAPGLGTKVVNQFGATLDPTMPGYVFELGLAVAFVPVPEPATLALIAPAAMFLIRRRRSR